MQKPALEWAIRIPVLANGTVLKSRLAEMKTLLKAAVFACLASVLCAQTAPATHRKQGMMPTQQNPATTPQVPVSEPAQQQRQVPAPASSVASPAQAATNPQVPAAQTQQQAETSKVPASAPRISYQNNELTVVAENASLGEVLNGIRAATGMKIEGSSGSADRVTAKIGPAPVRDVLLSLLEGSRFDFAMLGSETDPQRVERLLLSARSTSSATNTATPQPQPSQDVPDASAVSDDDDNPGIAQPPAQPATIAPAQPVKTPEQLLEDLRKLEADRAAQQQRQNTTPTTPADPNAPRVSRPERPK